MYKFYNANSRGNFTNDCVIRSISVAQNRTWDEVYNELTFLAREQGLLMDDIKFVEGYLDKRYKRACHKSKTIDKFIRECDEGIYLVTMAGHITVIIDGVLYDTFDCRDRRMWCAWCVE